MHGKPGKAKEVWRWARSIRSTSSSLPPPPPTRTTCSSCRSAAPGGPCSLQALPPASSVLLRMPFIHLLLNLQTSDEVAPALYAFPEFPQEKFCYSSSQSNCPNLPHSNFTLTHNHLCPSLSFRYTVSFSKASHFFSNLLSNFHYRT